MSVYPTELKLDEQGNLVIVWSDGQQRIYTVQELVENCPAADAVEKRRQAAEAPPNPFEILAPEEAEPQRIVAMEPMGRYAYSIRFNYGSNNGIYRLEMLRALGTEIEQAD